jgi:hypothetical protein
MGHRVVSGAEPRCCRRAVRARVRDRGRGVRADAGDPALCNPTLDGVFGTFRGPGANEKSATNRNLHS